MIPKAHPDDVKLISFYLGKVIIGLAVTMVIPLVLGLALGEHGPCLDFLLSIELLLLIGLVLTSVRHAAKTLGWMHGMIVASLAWLAAMFLGAVPLYLSGHFASYLDACFESMSGFATTGLSLIQDLDHLSYTHNLWRHLIMFIGGQGIVVIALSMFVKGFTGGFTMYVGEARDEKILPNVAHTSQFIWLVSIVFLVLGTGALALAGLAAGMRPFAAFFHGACVFMAAFDTGGFTPQSQSILYYHSAPYEVITIIIMILGAINFKLHYYLWTGNPREIVRNIETRTFFVSVLTTFAVVASGLWLGRTYPGAFALFRKGFYQLISAHTGTGYQTVYAAQFTSDWGELALAGLIGAMALGGAVCSTTGAIKMIRVGVIVKALGQDIKRIILPSRAIVVQKFHHIKEVFLEDKLVRPAFMITLAYLALYGLGAVIGMFCGYPFLASLFESTSAAANVGLSCGVTAVGMPALLKVTYILQMWAGRLEFMAVLTLFGFIYAALRGK